jgi:hypothetical protein
MDRGEHLRALADDVADRQDVADAWTAKSFTDRLFVVEVDGARDLPAAVEDPAFAGDLSGGDRYRFVDVQTRGDLQSYVVD